LSYFTIPHVILTDNPQNTELFKELS